MTRIVSWTGLDGRNYQAALSRTDVRLLIECYGAEPWSARDLDHYCRFAGMCDYWTTADSPHAESRLAVIN